MISSWFGNYIYKVRVDELIPEPDYTEAIMYVVNHPLNTDRTLGQAITNAISILKTNFKTQGGSFLFDAFESIKTDTNKINQFCNAIGTITGTPTILKIYDPKTTALWVEKYEVIIKDGTAKIEYRERFLTPVVVPLKNRPNVISDWDVDTIHDHFSRLHSMCYVPYD